MREYKILNLTAWFILFICLIPFLIIGFFGQLIIDGIFNGSILYKNFSDWADKEQEDK